MLNSEIWNSNPPVEPWSMLELVGVVFFLLPDRFPWAATATFRATLSYTLRWTEVKRQLVSYRRPPAPTAVTGFKGTIESRRSSLPPKTWSGRRSSLIPSGLSNPFSTGNSTVSSRPTAIVARTTTRRQSARRDPIWRRRPTTIIILSSTFSMTDRSRMMLSVILQPNSSHIVTALFPHTVSIYKFLLVPFRCQI